MKIAKVCVMFIIIIITLKSVALAQSKIDVNASTSNTDLKIMRLNKEGISPDFQKEIKQYYFVADNSINNLEVTAIPENSKSKVTIKGNTNLKQGLNTIIIQVTSEDKTKTSTYKINVTKTANKELANANLENLAIRDIMLYPSFDSNITHYEIEVPNEIENLDILAIPEDIKSKVTITGKDNLKIGDNTIEVKVIAQDNITKKVYEIKAHRRNNEEEILADNEEKNNIEQLTAILEDEQKNQTEVTTKNNNMDISNIMIIFVVLAIIIGVLVIYIIRKNRQNNKT